MKKIVLSHAVKTLHMTEEALAMMREVAQVSVPCDNSDAMLHAEVRDANAVVIDNKTSITRSLIESAGRLKHIARTGVGVDTIDIQAATEHGIIVTNMSGLTADSVAEFTMSLLLGLAKNIPRCDRVVREGNWDERRQLGHENIELNRKTHGIVGMGRIGRRVAVRCQGFGMRVIYHKRNRDLEFEKTAGVKYTTFEALLKESDSISLHLPLTDETTNLFDRPQFESMKRTALLINQARGKVVNEAALVQAMRENLIGGYGTDVYENEPPDPKSELFTLKNVVVSPHVGGVTRESQLRYPIMVAEELRRVLRGDIPKNVVNREVLKRV